MPRTALINLLIGFAVLFFAAASGAFVAFDMTEAFLKDQSLINNWQSTLLRSSHGHTNLFGMIHVLLGLTLPYSRFPVWGQRLQTIGLSLGTLAMGPGMMMRASLGPKDSLDAVGLAIGIGLSCALIAIFSHVLALSYRVLRS